MHNEAVEPDGHTHQYHVIVDSATPGANEQALYCATAATATGQHNAPKAFTARESQRFLADQFVYLRNMCDIPVATLSDSALNELCFLRFLAYKQRLIALRL